MQALPVDQQVGILAGLAFKGPCSRGYRSRKRRGQGNQPSTTGSSTQYPYKEASSHDRVVPKKSDTKPEEKPKAEGQEQETMFTKRPDSEDQANSPESLAKTKDGSTFAAKARAAELNANRARIAATKYAHQLAELSDDGDAPPLAPISLGSLKFIRSRSRAPKSKPQNSLTEQPEASDENNLKSPSPQQHPLQILQRDCSSQQSTSSLDTAKASAAPSASGDVLPVSTNRLPVAASQSEVISQSLQLDSRQNLQAEFFGRHSLQQHIFSFDSEETPTAPLAGLEKVSRSIDRPIFFPRQPEQDRPASSDNSRQSIQHPPSTKRYLQQSTISHNQVEKSTAPTSRGIKDSTCSDEPPVSVWPTEPALQPSPRYSPRVYDSELATSVFSSVTPSYPEMLPFGQGSFNSTPRRRGQPAHDIHQAPDSAYNIPHGIGSDYQPSTPLRHFTDYAAFSSPLHGLRATSDSRESGLPVQATPQRGVTSSGFSPVSERTNQFANDRVSRTNEVFRGRSHLPYGNHGDFSEQDVRYGENSKSSYVSSHSQYVPISPSRQQASVSQGYLPASSRDQQRTRTRLDREFAEKILNHLGSMMYEDLMALTGQQKALVNDAEYTLGQKLTDWTLPTSFAKEDPNILDSTPLRTGFKDLNAYNNHSKMAPALNDKPNACNQARTVAYDPFAKQPPTTIPASTPISMLKPQAAVYTPQNAVLKSAELPITGESKKTLDSAVAPYGLEPGESKEAQLAAILTTVNARCNSAIQTASGTATSESHSAQYASDQLSMEAAGNVAMRSIAGPLKRQTLEDSVQSFRSNAMDNDFDVMKQQLYGRTDAILNSLIDDSLPDFGIVSPSAATPKPKPIGHGRPNTADASPTVASGFRQKEKPIDHRAGSDLMARVITNLQQHKDPKPGDPFNRYGPPPPWAIVEGSDANSSFFDPDWKSPPSRVARDPRRADKTTTSDGRPTYREDLVRGRGLGNIGGTGSGNFSGSFGRR